MDILIQSPEKCEQFCALFQHIKFMTEHINVVFEKHQLYIQCIDNSHVAIMELRIPNAWFARYDHNSSANITIGMNVVLFYRILSAREKNQQIHLLFGEGDDNLTFHLTSENKAEFDKHFEMPLVDVDAEMMDIPAIDYQAELSLSSPHFYGLVHQLKMFGDTMDIQCSEDKILLASHSHNQGKMFVEINIDDLSSFAIEEGGKLNLSFSLAYLNNIMQYHKISKEVELGFSESTPMKLKFVLLSSTEETPLELAFYLAPKINDD